ncbi:hypothetical protein Q5P01_018918 [Channa striata]|uniref:Uncharacterized protein n=1 Tax=Channa striata TaxID=64152 RepID=A0AA88M6Q9_CHASR|nr:hypothetical protein Q5P01_018918 [Channa striata]
MLPPNLLILSMVIFLAMTVSMAPVEEKEQEEIEATEEGELSEEEEDDDDSHNQDKIEGLLGRQQTTTAAASEGSVVTAGVSSNIQDLSSPGAQSAGGQSHERAAGSSVAGAPSSSAASQPTGFPGSAKAEPFSVSAVQTQPADVLGLYGSGSTHLENTGTIDPSSHDFLPGLLGGGNRFGPDVHINVPGNGRQTHLAQTNAVTDRAIFFTDFTASGVELGHDVTGKTYHFISYTYDSPVETCCLSSDHIVESPIVLHTDPVNAFTGTPGVYSHTELTTVPTDLRGTETISDATRNPAVYSHPAMTDYTQVAGPVTEQFNTSGQGPEGAENVELEDTC